MWYSCLLAVAFWPSDQTAESDTELRDRIERTFAERGHVAQLRAVWDAEWTVVRFPDAVPALQEPLTTKTPGQRLELAGPSVRYEGFSEPTSKTRSMPAIRRISSWNGTDSRIRYPDAEKEEAEVYVDGGSQYVDRRNHCIAPLWLHYRTNHDIGLPINIQSFEVEPDVVKIDNIPCRVLHGDSGQNAVTIYVAPQLDCAILRYCEATPRGDRLYQVDTRFERQDQGVIPKSWQATWYNRAGHAHQKMKATIQDLQHDPPMTAAQLQVPFCPGAVVRDHKEGIVFQVQADGSYEVRGRMQRERLQQLRRFGVRQPAQIIDAGPLIFPLNVPPPNVGRLNWRRFEPIFRNDESK